MSRNALIITGQVRTFSKTWENILNNVIIPNNFDVFMYIDNRGKPDPEGLSIAGLWPLPIKNDFVKELKFMSQEDTLEYEKDLQNILQKPQLLQSMTLKGWDARHYLRYSGSIVEYFQYFQGVSMMEKYENIHGFKYDYVMRGRCDIAFTEPFKIIEFFKLLPSLKIIGEIEKGSNDLSINTDFPDSKYFEVFPKDELINLGPIFKNIYSLGGINCTNPKTTIFTIRKNVIWCGTRENMIMLKDIFFSYGNTYKEIPGIDDWNSEAQFNLFLSKHNIYHIDYFTKEDGVFFCDMEYNAKFLEDPGNSLFTIVRS